MGRAFPWGFCGQCGKTMCHARLPDKPGAPFLWGGVNEKGERHRCERGGCPAPVQIQNGRCRPSQIRHNEASADGLPHAPLRL